MNLQKTDFDRYPINPEHDPRYNPDVRDVTQPPDEARDIGEWYNNPDVRDITRPETWCDYAKNAVGWILAHTPRGEWKEKIRKIQKEDPLPSRIKEDGTKYYDRDECDEWGRKHGLKTASKKQGGKPEECPPFHKPDGNGGYQYVPTKKWDAEQETPYYEPPKQNEK